MSAPLHLNLLKDDERFSASPIRIRVMLPVFALLTALGITVWWSVLSARVHSLELQKAATEANLAELKPGHDALLALRAEEQDTAATLKQLGFYKNARIRFGEPFTGLIPHVPDKLQLTELRVPPPPPQPPPNPKSLLPGPTNPVERVTLRLAGRTSGSEPVNALLQTLLENPVFTNLIRSAEIPKGAFRQDTARSTASHEMLLFELTCECSPRRFE